MPAARLLDAFSPPVVEIERRARFAVGSVQEKSTEEPFRQDEFLRTPTLFKHGPWMLLAMGALLSGLFFLAGQWRIEAGRLGIYEDTLHFARTTAGAARENASLVLGRLRQSTHGLQALRNHPDPRARVIDQFQEGLGLREEGIEALAVSRSGAVVASTVPLPEATTMARRIGAAARLGSGQAPIVLPAMPGEIGGRLLMPIIHRLDMPIDVEFVVYLVDAGRFTAVAQAAFGGQQGWLRFEDEFGRALLEATTSGYSLEAGMPLHEQVTSAAEAMAAPMRYDSSRLLIASTSPSPEGLTVVAGLREADALAPFKPRVDATWLIAAFASGLLMSLVGLTALALRNFAVKERYLRRVATVDILSDLPNRRSFNHLLAQAVDQSGGSGEPFALFLVDIDNFKYVNDSLGHETGDRLLRHVGSVLTRTVGRRGTVCRLGGDEFTVMLPDIASIEEAESAGKRLVEALRGPFLIDGVEVTSRASLGAALMPGQARTASDLMRFADTALYRAKKNGKGCCVVYDEEMVAEGLAQAAAMRDLERGIAHDEFFLVYQPKFITETGELSGFEALLRWQHPKRGTVGPNEFIPLAEESGLIVELGDQVLEQAVRQVYEWQQAGYGWHQVAINVSQLQLRGKDFAVRVGQVLNRYGAPGSCLQLELTESSLAVDGERAQALVHALRGLGVSVAVDDFGTGYSSMGALQRFELDFLKVDRSFVAALLTPHGEEICRAIVSLGHALNMRVIAEGVETIEQRQVLARLGCDEMQGFLYSRPVPPEEAIAFANCQDRSLAGWSSMRAGVGLLAR